MNRLGFIGGSDCVKIMQGEWLKLWQIKTGKVDGDDLSRNIAVQLGVHTENFNLNWFEQEHDCELTNQQAEYLGSINGVPAKGTIDAMYNKDIVEAKHTNPYNNMDKAIEFYMPQIQLYAHLANANGIYMSVIFGNSKWESAYVLRNKEYFDSMWAVVSDFWGHVLRDEEPIGVDVPNICIDKIEVDQMVKRDASRDNAFIAAAHDYIEHEPAAKSFEAAKKSMKEMVGPNEREVYSNSISLKRDKRGALRITVRH
tara:strand:+ start:5102 stop:5869 length:768 start_codon:yes stop_codon:yes gene_type:complete